jgi:anti-sigma B factor antagonist
MLPEFQKNYWNVMILFFENNKLNLEFLITGGTVVKIAIDITHHPQNKDITLLAVRGQIDTLTAPEFRSKLLSLLMDKKFKLIIDLDGVDYIGSAGWGIFISEIKQIREQKGDLVLAGMNPGVLEVYHSLEFGSILKAYPTVESAFQKGFQN